MIALSCTILSLLPAVFCGGKAVRDAIGAIFCVLVLVLLLVQALQGFRAKDELVQSVSMDDASIG